MNEPDRKFWPFRPRTSIAWSIALLVGLLFVITILKKYNVWEICVESDTAVLIGVVLVSLLPVLLAVLDIIIERGGVIEYGGVKIDFSQVSSTGTSGFTVPANIGVPGEPVSDSSITKILDTLEKATGCQTIVIDLEEGQAWWETRLLVLLAGAVRLGKPEKVVFVGKEGGVAECFQGWGYTVKMLPYLLRAHPQYLRSYHAAQAAARQWQLVEPVNPPDPTNVAVAPPQPPSMQPGLATLQPAIAFNVATGLPNPLYAEQLLASDLGAKVKRPEGPRVISIVRLNELFQPVLYKTAIDTEWSTERQLNEFFDSTIDRLAVTRKGKYLSLTSRLAVLSAFVRNLAEKK